MTGENLGPEGIARATVRGMPGVVAMWSETRGLWLTPDAVKGWVWHSRGHVTDYVPLYVLGPDERAVPKAGGVWVDLTKRDAVDRICDIYCKYPSPGWAWSLHEALTEYAATQSTPTPPPLPPEPEGDVRVVDGDGNTWRSCQPGGYYRLVHNVSVDTWADLVRDYGPLTVYRPDPEPTS